MKIGDHYEDTILGFATLCHDFGKPYVATKDKHGIHFYEHDAAGVLPTSTFLNSINAPGYLIEAVLPLVRWHMRPRFLTRTPAEVLHLANVVGRIDRLLRLCYADFVGRAGWEEKYDEGAEKWLWEMARSLGVLSNTPIPIIQGRDLINIGMPPSRNFSEILKRCFRAQLNYEFRDHPSGIAYLKKIL
jgi:tRNA nucleotidyltransferase (CCA-adding enzyme)